MIPPHGVSRGGVGLMQLRLPAARAGAERVGLQVLEEHELLEPALNVRLGTAYLALMKDLFGDWPLALTAYNMGPARLERLIAEGRQPQFRYATPVLARWEELQSLQQRRAIAGASR